VRAYAVIVAAVVVMGLGLVGNLAAPGKDATTSAPPPASAPVAAATPRATRAPTPAPTPVPTLAPMVAAITTAELAPTGVLVADTGDPAIHEPVADVNGSIWATRAGAVINMDPHTGRSREWTLADDPAFAGASLAPARQGGVWLVTEEAIRLFDGERFRAVIEMPDPAWFMVENGDGTIWAQTDRYGLIRWADGTWTSDPPGRPTRGAIDIAVDGEGRVWTADFGVDEPGGDWSARGISIWDGSAWTSVPADELPNMPIGGWSAPSLTVSADGSVWVAVGNRVARFSASGWTRYDEAQIDVSASLSAVGDDGRLWFVLEDCESCGVRIQAYDGSALTTYGKEDGLPGATDVEWPGATVLPGPGYVLAATEAGLYRLADGSWQRLRTSTASGLPATESSVRGDVHALAASSRDEVWVTTRSAGWTTPALEDRGLFRFDGADWRRQRLPVETTVGQVIVGPDGALWVATSSGPLVRRDGTWTDLGDTVAAVAPEPGEDADGCGGVVFMGNGGVVYYAGPRSANQLVALRLVGSTWKARLHPAPLGSFACSAMFALTTDGTIWRLQRGWVNDLSYWADGRWQEVSPPEVDEPDAQVNVSAIVADGEGSLLAAVNSWDPTALTPRADVLQLAAGQWVRRSSVDGMREIAALAWLPDGSLIAVGDGVATFDGQRWHRLWRGFWLSAMSVAPDGAVWVVGSNVYRIPPVLP